MDYQISAYISQGLSWLINIVILIACIILVVKHKKMAFKIMLIGFCLSLFFGIASTVSMVLSQGLLNYSMEDSLNLSGLLGIGQSLSFGLFGFGLFIYAFNYKKQLEQ